MKMKMFAASLAATALLFSCSGAPDGFTSAEKDIILSQGNVMRVLSTASPEDSLLLRGVSSEIPSAEIASETYAALAAKMVATVTSPEQDGVGIAGPQVGIFRRVVAVQRFDRSGEPFEVYPNISIVAKRGSLELGPEGCLSVPGIRGDVPRYRDIDIRYTSPYSLQDTVETVQGFTAVIFQHECDHLDGVLFPDRMAVPFDFQARNDYMFSRAKMQYRFEPCGKAKARRWQKNLKAEIRRAIGLTVIEEQLAQYEPVAWKIDSEDIGFAVRERWQIRTEPLVDLPFVVIIPKNIEGKAPLMITPHGHGINTEQYAGIYLDASDSLHAVKGDRNMAYRFAQEGFVTVSPTARGFGVTRTPKDIAAGNQHSCRELHVNDLLVGRTPVGDRVWDVSKLIDWSLENLPVDPSKIVVTGNSGGGTASLFAGAMDERIAVTVPASAFCPYADSWGSLHHCDCGYIPGIMNLCDMGDLAGLIAPRSLCIIQGHSDYIAPIEPAREEAGHAAEIFRTFGAADKFEFYEGPGGHRYYFDAARDFVNSML